MLKETKGAFDGAQSSIFHEDWVSVIYIPSHHCFIVTIELATLNVGKQTQLITIYEWWERLKGKKLSVF